MKSNIILAELAKPAADGTVADSKPLVGAPAVDFKFTVLIIFFFVAAGS